MSEPVATLEHIVKLTPEQDRWVHEMRDGDLSKFVRTSINRAMKVAQPRPEEPTHKDLINALLGACVRYSKNHKELGKPKRQVMREISQDLNILLHQWRLYRNKTTTKPKKRNRGVNND